MSKPSQSTDHMNGGSSDPNWTGRDSTNKTPDTTAGLFQGPDMMTLEKDQYKKHDPQSGDRNFP